MTVTAQGPVDAVESELVPAPATDSPAAVQALEAVCAHANVSEREIAEALGVSRATMNNYRAGKTPFKATPAQIEVLAGLLRTHGEALTNALFVLEN